MLIQMEIRFHAINKYETRYTNFRKTCRKCRVPLVESLLRETNSCFVSPVGTRAGGVWEGERRAAGVRQLCSPADRRLLPRYPGASCQCPGGIMLTTLTSDPTRLTPGRHIICSWAQVPLPPLNEAPGSTSESWGIISPRWASLPRSPRPPWNKLPRLLSAFLSHVSLMSGL